jgi:D-threonate/D-erythronate kinase
MQVRIISDDFTSATDGLVAFAARLGGASVVLPWARTHRAAGNLPLALSVDTDSRLSGNEEAVRRVSGWAYVWRDADVLIKQFDSTLRGPLASECLAAWRGSGRRRLLIAPAFPAAGRTMRQGHVFVGGVPLNQTAFARDPLTPVSEDSLPLLFAAHGIELAVASDADDAARLFDQGQRAVVADAAHETELRALASRFIGERDILWAGSTGIARALAHGLVANASSCVAPQCSAHPYVLVGSRHPASRQQAERLAQTTSGVRLLVTPEELMNPEQAVRHIARQAADAVKRGECDGVVATGGETAKALAALLDAQSLDVLYEVEAGIPMCRLNIRVAGDVQTLPLVTKAGGFGNDETLIACVQALMRPLSRPACR